MYWVGCSSNLKEICESLSDMDSPVCLGSPTPSPTSFELLLWGEPWEYVRLGVNHNIC